MATQQWKHHVFVSFRGEDTRHNFVCHLDKALRRTGLNTFVDNQLRRGEEINTALLQAIQDSKVALIIFSENYASSSWCLDELLKIVECHETHNQIVIPVFYRVNQSDVRKQNGSFEESFAKHSENPSYSNKIQKWKDALTQAANISGRDSNAIREEDKLIDLIVGDVLEKLKHPSPRSLEGFVGLKSKISQVKTLLATGSSDVRMLGIWGMGGIGKTTLAEAIFAEVSSQFEGHCIVEKVREAWEKGGEKRLLKQLFSELLEQSDVKIDRTIISPEPFLVERLKSKRVFVVFDDVSDRSQLEYLIGNQCWFGARSNIIITSRDKQVFEGINDINIYKVEALSGTQSHQLFVSNAFKEKQPSQDHIPLIDKFLNYARGNPLAIKVLGSFVCGKGVKIWRDALKKLSKCPYPKIQNVLKLSYDGLDEEEKAIFLHIACFFKGENIDEAKRVISSCGLSVDVGVSVLVDKSLVTIISKYDKLDMHDLLQEMGRQIIRQESNNDPRRSSRLWDAEDIRRVFEENEGTEAIETQYIILNTSQIRDDIVLDPNVFKRMPNLKVLRFYTYWGGRSKLHLTERLRFLPSGLRYLHWDGYSFESLPAGFHAKELVVLDLPNSNIKQILEEVKIHIVFGMLPFGIGNKVPSSSCQFFSKITSLDMSCCQNLKSFPNNVDLQCLEILNLWGCSNLKIFSEISTNLRKLNVGYTAIKEIHSSSIEGLSRLEELNMQLCDKLESLPSNICKLQDLQKLYLAHCSRLKKFPEILKPMYKLRTVDLSYSAIEAIPSSIDNMIQLEYLCLENCLNLTCFPESFGNFMRRIADFGFSTACKQLKKPHNLLDFENLECLFFRISNGEFFEAKITINCGYLNDNEMPSHASECIFYLIDLPSHPCLRFFSPYYILDLWSWRIRELPKDLAQDVHLCYPGSRIPEWFRHQTTGDIIRIKLPSNWFFNRRFFGFAFCVALNSDLILGPKKYVEFECYFEDNYNPTIRFTYQTNFNLNGAAYNLLTQQHVLVWCLRDFNVWISERRHSFGHHCMASFKFFIRGGIGDIKKCGITPLYMQDDGDEDAYDDDEDAFWMLQSSLLTEMSTNEDDDEDMNPGDADDMFSEDDEKDEHDKGCLWLTAFQRFFGCLT
ncbi:hypothetical protein K2173_007100 [Erythroxylum novogranatense]|uniref:ADP-ribosyl cyclase/cyclic ADP-ribose hydrolase n=1 Tax=Erythroxylum novogranatense TaxID=1862640 RepID=A0AAV8SYD7_9ROSI|nr:hypothetical protein K2173_007100 [Erythroxylum novogranatense]